MEKNTSLLLGMLDKTGGKTMKLRDVLATISGGTPIRIFAGCTTIFSGKMAEITKKEWNLKVGGYMDCEVFRMNTVNGAITLAI